MTDLTLTDDSPDTGWIAQLRDAVTGQVIEPDDADYDTARTVFLGGIDRRPAVIVKVADAQDIAHVVALAKSTGLTLAIRSGGHSLHAVCDNGIVLDLSNLNSLDIDAEARTAWAGAGLTAGAYTAATAPYGLATGFGDTGSVGLGGITTGGGIGYLVRKLGLTIDSLLAADVVTADGQLVRADEETNPDLFWAIRGGGGNFGVITRFKFQLHEVDRAIGGMTFLPLTPETLVEFVALADAAPEELSTIANVMTAPPLPFLPEEKHGEVILLAELVYAGDPEVGDPVVAPLRALGTPFADMVQPMQYAEIYPPADPDYHPTTLSRTVFIDEIGLDVATMIFEQLKASTAITAVAQVRVLGGAMARVDPDATAFAHRQRGIMVNVAAVYEDVADFPIHQAWADNFAGLLNVKNAAYVNFLAEDGATRLREAYPGDTWDRLAEIKAKYDPDNVFRFNQNILPAGRSAA